MAHFNAVIDSSLARELTATLTEEEKYQILEAGGEVLTKSFTEAVKTKFTQRSGDLGRSITAGRADKGDGPTVIVSPEGKHSPSGKGIRKRKKREVSAQAKAHGYKETAKTNAAVGFILEYGSPRISATNWMSDSAEQSETGVVAAEGAAYNAIMEGKT